MFLCRDVVLAYYVTSQVALGSVIEISQVALGSVIEISQVALGSVILTGLTGRTEQCY